jgi:hypothetical protein
MSAAEAEAQMRTMVFALLEDWTAASTRPRSPDR